METTIFPNIPIRASKELKQEYNRAQGFIQRSRLASVLLRNHDGSTPAILSKIDEANRIGQQYRNVDSEQRNNQYVIVDFQSQNAALSGIDKATTASPRRPTISSTMHSSPRKIIGAAVTDSDPAALIEMNEISLSTATAPPTVESHDKMYCRLAYKNCGLWSMKSIALEQQIRSLIGTSVSKNWPDYNTLGALRCGLSLGVVDSFIIFEEEREARYGITRLHSKWSYAADSFLFERDWCDKIEIDSVLFTLVNDYEEQKSFNRRLQFKKKEQPALEMSEENISGGGGNTNAGTGTGIESVQQAAAVNIGNSANMVRVPVDCVPKVVKMNRTDAMARKTTAAVVSRMAAIKAAKATPEYKVKVQAILRAITAEGELHVRPLCTSGDVVLAVRELLDPTIFAHGCVQLPHAVSGVHERHLGGIYRYTYSLNRPGQWSYLRMLQSSNLQGLRSFLCPALMLETSPSAFQQCPLDSDDELLHDLREFSLNFSKTVRQHYGEQKMVVEMVVDIEACLDSSRLTKPPAPELVPAPHMLGVANARSTLLNQQATYHYRVLHIAKIRFTKKVSALRRNAVGGLDSLNKIYLRNFNAHFQAEWDYLCRNELNRRNEELLSGTHVAGNPAKNTEKEASAQHFQSNDVPIVTSRTVGLQAAMNVPRLNIRHRSTLLQGEVAEIADGISKRNQKRAGAQIGFVNDAGQVFTGDGATLEANRRVHMSQSEAIEALAKPTETIEASITTSSCDADRGQEGDVQQDSIINGKYDTTEDNQSNHDFGRDTSRSAMSVRQSSDTGKLPQVAEEASKLTSREMFGIILGPQHMKSEQQAKFRTENSNNFALHSARNLARQCFHISIDPLTEFSMEDHEPSRNTDGVFFDDCWDDKSSDAAITLDDVVINVFKFAAEAYKNPTNLINLGFNAASSAVVAPSVVDSIQTPATSRMRDEELLARYKNQLLQDNFSESKVDMDDMMSKDASIFNAPTPAPSMKVKQPITKKRRLVDAANALIATQRLIKPKATAKNSASSARSALKRQNISKRKVLGGSIAEDNYSMHGSISSNSTDDFRDSSGINSSSDDDDSKSNRGALFNLKMLQRRLNEREERERIDKFDRASHAHMQELLQLRLEKHKEQLKKQEYRDAFMAVQSLLFAPSAPTLTEKRVNAKKILVKSGDVQLIDDPHSPYHRSIHAPAAQEKARQEFADALAPTMGQLLGEVELQQQKQELLAKYSNDQDTAELKLLSRKYRESQRNDRELNESAYRLAEKLSPRYLLTKFQSNQLWNGQKIDVDAFVPDNSDEDNSIDEEAAAKLAEEEEELSRKQAERKAIATAVAAATMWLGRSSSSMRGRETRRKRPSAALSLSFDGYSSSSVAEQSDNEETGLQPEAVAIAVGNEQMNAISTLLADDIDVEVLAAKAAAKAEVEANEAAEMKEQLQRLYEEELERQMEILLKSLPPAMEKRIRAAFAAYQKKIAAQKRRTYMRQRRKQRRLENQQVKRLQQFYLQQLRQHVNGTDRSADSDDEDGDGEESLNLADVSDARKPTKRELRGLLNEYGDETGVQTVLRVHIQRNIKEKKEELRLINAQTIIDQSKDAEAKEREEEERQQQQRAKSAEAALADRRAPRLSQIGKARSFGGHGSSFRQSIRTLCAMHLTAVMLDGDIVASSAATMAETVDALAGGCGSVDDAGDSNSIDKEAIPEPIVYRAPRGFMWGAPAASALEELNPSEENDVINVDTDHLQQQGHQRHQLIGEADVQSTSLEAVKATAIVSECINSAARIVLSDATVDMQELKTSLLVLDKEDGDAVDSQLQVHTPHGATLLVSDPSDAVGRIVAIANPQNDTEIDMHSAVIDLISTMQPVAIRAQQEQQHEHLHQHRYQKPPVQQQPLTQEEQLEQQQSNQQPQQKQQRLDTELGKNHSNEPTTFVGDSKGFVTGTKRFITAAGGIRKAVRNVNKAPALLPSMEREEERVESFMPRELAKSRWKVMLAMKKHEKSSKAHIGTDSPVHEQVLQPTPPASSQRSRQCPAIAAVRRKSVVAASAAAASPVVDQSPPQPTVSLKITGSCVDNALKSATDGSKAIRSSGSGNEKHPSAAGSKIDAVFTPKSGNSIRRAGTGTATTPLSGFGHRITYTPNSLRLSPPMIGSISAATPVAYFPSTYLEEEDATATAEEGLIDWESVIAEAREIAFDSDSRLEFQSTLHSSNDLENSLFDCRKPSVNTSAIIETMSSSSVLQPPSVQLAKFGSVAQLYPSLSSASAERDAGSIRLPYVISDDDEAATAGIVRDAPTDTSPDPIDANASLVDTGNGATAIDDTDATICSKAVIHQAASDVVNSALKNYVDTLFTDCAPL